MAWGSAGGGGAIQSWRSELGCVLGGGRDLDLDVGSAKVGPVSYVRRGAGAGKDLGTWSVGWAV